MSLSTYQQLVESQQWEFPSFVGCCSICEGKGCAVRHGLYWRNAIVEGETIRIPVARYRCRRKGKAGGKAHRTFSLLPVQLHPYKRYASGCSYAILKESLALSLTQTLDRFEEKFANLCISTISRIRKVFEEAGMRLRMQGYLPQARSDLLIEVVECIDSWWNELMGCKTDFYSRHGMFLLSNPSQNR